MKVAREGQQSGKESTAFANVVPLAASSLRTFGICATSAAAWSSVITTRMFGRPSWPVPTGRAAAGPAVASSATATAAATGQNLTGRPYSACHTVSTSLLAWAHAHLEGRRAADAAGEQGAHRRGRDGADPAHAVRRAHGRRRDARGRRRAHDLLPALRRPRRPAPPRRTRRIRGPLPGRGGVQECARGR